MFFFGNRLSLKRSLLVQMVHSQRGDLLVDLPCDPANFSSRNPHRFGDTGDVCGQNGTMGKPGAERNILGCALVQDEFLQSQGRFDEKSTL
jgi:hypothetical protein